jgi:flagellar motor switch protein FliM
MMSGAINRPGVVIHYVDAVFGKDGDIAIREKEHLASMLEKRGDVAGDKIFSIAEPYDRGWANARRDNLVRITG